MMSLATIQEISERAAQRARKSKQEPAVYDGERMTIPFLGNYVPKGWRRTDREELFVDISGWGAPGEPALTQAQMFAQFRVGYGYALTEHGQFQGYVAEYERVT